MAGLAAADVAKPEAYIAGDGSFKSETNWQTAGNHFNLTLIQKFNGRVADGVITATSTINTFCEHSYRFTRIQ
jgi:hypothetical protein